MHLIAVAFKQQSIRHATRHRATVGIEMHQCDLLARHTLTDTPNDGIGDRVVAANDRWLDSPLGQKRCRVTDIDVVVSISVTMVCTSPISATRRSATSKPSVVLYRRVRPGEPHRAHGASRPDRSRTVEGNTQINRIQPSHSKHVFARVSAGSPVNYDARWKKRWLFHRFLLQNSSEWRMSTADQSSLRLRRKNIHGPGNENKGSRLRDPLSRQSE